MLSLIDLKNQIEKTANKRRALQVMNYFKTGKGGYAADDVFVGLTVPQSRVLATIYKDLLLNDVEQLMISKIHEERLIALFILVNRFKKSSEEEKKEIYEFYLSHIAYINNWDLVDASAEHIVGGYLRNNKKNSEKTLGKLAASTNLWERRISIIATFEFIKHGDYDMTFQIAGKLLHDKQALIHKAVGWMLREVGKRCSQEAEEQFLYSRYKIMPRTMLRYAIERFPEEKRKAYLQGLI